MTHPHPAYHFTVQWGGTSIGFSEVLGLNIYLDVVTYREGSDPQFMENKMPGMIRYSNITLKRGIRKGDNEFFAWMSTQKLNTIERRDITIQLLDEEHNPIVIWKVRQAFPVRYSGPQLQAQSSHIAMEELEIAHEGMSVETV